MLNKWKITIILCGISIVFSGLACSNQRENISSCNSFLTEKKISTSFGSIKKIVAIRFFHKEKTICVPDINIHLGVFIDEGKYSQLYISNILKDSHSIKLVLQDMDDDSQPELLVFAHTGSKTEFLRLYNFSKSYPYLMQVKGKAISSNINSIKITDKSTIESINQTTFEVNNVYKRKLEKKTFAVKDKRIIEKVRQ